MLQRLSCTKSHDALAARPTGTGRGYSGYATKPYKTKHYFQRPQDLVHKIDLQKRLKQEQTNKLRFFGMDYSKTLAKHGG